MKITLEAIEKVMNQAGVDYAAAKEALLKAEGDAEKAIKDLQPNKGCCSEEPVELLEEMAVKWVSLNRNPIQLGRASYKR
ncbi:hypothetical protein [Butyrivibrio sp. AC2005]|uniref:hypothetical protein n=1 Tax=Butyrivibrio sp. AC2005 TaxID=1280672 RepID=UPI0003FFF9D9|nr:hypothetical protein [Butyrivibrio sp. AC2005]